MKKFFIIAILICIFVAMGMGAGILISGDSPGKKTQDIQGLLWPNPKLLKSFMTIDKDGNVFGLDELRGKWSFLFFGYTHCPDVCPITLAVFNQIIEQLSRAGIPGDLQMIFVSVDTDRDTPQHMKEYVNHFNGDIIGLAGTSEQVQSLASQIGIVYISGEKSPSGDYYVDHTASIFLIDPLGRLVSVFSAPHEAGSIITRYERIRNFIENN